MLVAAFQLHLLLCPSCPPLPRPNLQSRSTCGDPANSRTRLSPADNYVTSSARARPAAGSTPRRWLAAHLGDKRKFRLQSTILCLQCSLLFCFYLCCGFCLQTTWGKAFFVLGRSLELKPHSTLDTSILYPYVRHLSSNCLETLACKAYLRGQLRNDTLPLRLLFN